jgi:hypothetical protein
MTGPVTFKANIQGDEAVETIVFDTTTHTATVDGIPTTVKVLDDHTAQIFAPYPGGNKILTFAPDAKSATLTETVYGTCYKTDFGLAEERYGNPLPTKTTHSAPVIIYPEQ